MSGHTDKVTCVAVSQGYSVIVSGSADCTCIIWDLNKLKFVGQLKLDAPVIQVAVNEISGHIKAITENTIYVWDINGQLLAQKIVCTDPAESIISCTLTKAPEWLDINVFITGHKDGTIKLWSISYEETNESENQDVLNLTLRTVLQGNTAPVTCLYISADQKKLFSGDSSGKVLCWARPPTEQS